MKAPARWLIDTSALRPHVPAFAEVLIPRIVAGLVSMCLVTELEIGYSARSNAEFERISRDVLTLLNRVIMPAAAEARARNVQRALIARGQHRAVAIPDLIVAAVAEIEGLTVLHHDDDFDLIAAITGQPVEWIVRHQSPAGPDRPDSIG